MALTFDEARACVLREVGVSMATETIALAEAAGRVLAEEVTADRDYPPFPRSARDGFAVRAADLPGELLVIGEVRAGEAFIGSVAAGQAVEIMTGAGVPDGADAVVMVEHTERIGERVKIDRGIQSGENFNPRGIEAHGGDVVLSAGVRIGYAETALLATVGRTSLLVYRRPRVAIVSTGDEIVEIGETPGAQQIRNSNAASLAVQVCRAGGRPEILGVARDNYESTRAQVRQGLEADLLLLSGGVSAGKYDLVEKVLAEFGAEFFFDRVMIQPGQPLVFGKAQGKYFFGLPGQPGIDHDYLRNHRARGHRKNARAARTGAAAAACAPHASVSAKAGAYAISARAAQRRRRDYRAGSFPRFRGRGGSGALQCLPGDRPRAGRVGGR